MPFKIKEPIVCIFYGPWLEISPGKEIAVPGPKCHQVVVVSGFAQDGGLLLEEFPKAKQGYDPTSFRPMTSKERAEYMVKNELIPLTQPQTQTA